MMPKKNKGVNAAPRMADDDVVTAILLWYADAKVRMTPTGGAEAPVTGSNREGEGVEPVFAYGCAGKLVVRLQRALAATEVTVDGKKQAALAATAVDGKFSEATRAAVRLVQRERREVVTGVVNAALWQSLTKTAWPEQFQRSLQLLGAFEGHGYTKPAGNYDGAGMTWGIAGFTIVWSEEVTDKKTKLKSRVYQHNTLHTCLQSMLASAPLRALAVDAFGEKNVEKLSVALDGTPKETYDFANGITDPADRGELIGVWKTGFAKLGLHEEIQNLQDQLARSVYWDKSEARAKEFATKYDMDSEQTRQMFFELWVNPGGMSASTRDEAFRRLDKLLHDNAKATIAEKLEVIANLYAELFWKNGPDITQRKGTIARGHGKVHGKVYRMECWGFDVVDPSLLLGLRLAVLSFEKSHISEQMALAKAAKAYVQEEAAAEMNQRWPGDNGTVVVENGDGSVRSLSLRPMLAADASALAGPDGDDLSHAIALVFQRSVGILSIFGQAAPVQVGRQRLVFGRGKDGYAGIESTPDGQLRLFRKRLAGFGGNSESRIDIADIRPRLASCRLIFLYCGNGVPIKRTGDSVGTAWRGFLEPVGGRPIILGWFGNGSVPDDSLGEFVSPLFFQALSKIDSKATLEQLCLKHEHAIVQAWGECCFRAFGSVRQRYLFRDGPFNTLSNVFPTLRQFGVSGAGAIDSGGKIWHAKDLYTGQGDSMQEVVA